MSGLPLRPPRISGWGFVTPQRESRDCPEVTHAPLAPAAATSPPTPGTPPPTHSSFCPLLTSIKREISCPKPHGPASLCTPRQFCPRVPACVLSPGPHAAPARHSSHPAAKLTRPGVFLRSFSCSPRRLSRGEQLCSLHLPVRSPPFFTSPEIA